MSIRRRLVLFGGGVVMLTVLLLGLLLYGLIAANATRTQDQQLAKRARQTAVVLQTAPPRSPTPQLAAAPVDPAQSTDPFVEVLGADGQVQFSGGEFNGAAPMAGSALLAEADARGSARATLQLDCSTAIRVFVRPWSRPSSGTHGYVVAAQSVRVRDQQLRGVGGFLIISALCTLVAALVANLLVPGGALRPLREMAATADRIGHTRDLSERLPPPRTGDEIGQLTASFNAMLARLQEAQQQLQEANQRLAEALAAQQRFVADASHELRTPLTSIRANAGFLRRQPPGEPADREAALQDIADESERMSRLVQDLLVLARADAGQHFELAPLELGALTTEICLRAQRLYMDRIFEATVQQATVNGNADALMRLLWILIDNAVKHTANGGRIALHTAPGAESVQLCVCDDGQGIPPSDLDRIFERFYQADRSRSDQGAGLGLAMARAIVQQHGGSIAARNNAERGATFEVKLPLAGPPP